MNKEITAFDVMLKRNSTEILKCLDIIKDYFLARDACYFVFGIIFILYLALIAPFRILFNILKFPFDLVNPDFDAAKEYAELQPYSIVYCGNRSMDFNIFCSHGYSMSLEESSEVIKNALTPDGKLNGIMLRDKMETSTLLTLQEDKNIYIISFGNRVNKAIFCIFYDLINFRKEGDTTYLVIPKIAKNILEERLSKELTEPVHIVMI